MARTIVLDSFPLSCMGKSRSNPATVTDICRQWVMDCLAAGNPVYVPAVAYYETCANWGEHLTPLFAPHSRLAVTDLLP